MESQSVVYGAIVFLALVFGDLGVTGIAAISGPIAALLLEIEAIRRQRNSANVDSQETRSLPATKYAYVRTLPRAKIQPPCSDAELVLR